MNDRLDQLIDRWRDEALSEAEASELSDMLRASAEVRELLVGLTGWSLVRVGAKRAIASPPQLSIAT